MLADGVREMSATSSWAWLLQRLVCGVAAGLVISLGLPSARVCAAGRATVGPAAAPSSSAAPPSCGTYEGVRVGYVDL